MPPRYLVQVPWLGPLQVDDVDGGMPCVAIGAACNPSLGEALAALLVPVGPGLAPSIAAESWQVRSLHCDGHGRFGVEAPPAFWGGGVAGMLMLLVHDRSGDAAAGSFPGAWSPVSSLANDEMREELRARVGQFLGEKSAKDLEPGVIERHPPKARHEVRFAVASCQFPAGFVDRDPAEASYERLAGQALNGLLLLGDQVYLDATAGLFDPSALYDRFHQPYERLLLTRGLRNVLRRVPAYMMLDDHEIEDNWEPVAGSDASERNLVEGRRSYLEYQRMAGPRPRGPASDPATALWYDFKLGDLPFFMADTRTERGPRTAETIETARIMHDPQRNSLRAWLGAQAKEVPKFIASPASFLPRHRRAVQHGHPASALRSDGWDGYPASFFDLLECIATDGIQNVIFLSGDEHVSFAVEGRITDKRSGSPVTCIYSIHSSGLYAPFPFANSDNEDLLWKDAFEFGGYRCEVVPLAVAPGDGFALLETSGDGAWSVRCRFDRASGVGNWIRII